MCQGAGYFRKSKALEVGVWETKYNMSEGCREGGTDQYQDLMAHPPHKSLIHAKETLYRVGGLDRANKQWSGHVYLGVWNSFRPVGLHRQG